MKSVFSAIARAFRAMATTMTTAWRYCRDTGRWIGETVASIGGGGVGGDAGYDVPEPLEPARSVDQLLADANALVKEISVPPALGGDGYDRIQRIAMAINVGDEPADEDIAELSELQLEWINTLEPGMRFVVGNCRKDELVEHMRGRKGLKGVIRCDEASLQDWKEAVARDNDRIRPMFSLPEIVSDEVPELRYAV